MEIQFCYMKETMKLKVNQDAHTYYKDALFITVIKSMSVTFLEGHENFRFWNFRVIIMKDMVITSNFWELICYTSLRQRIPTQARLEDIDACYIVLALMFYVRFLVYS